MSAEIILSHLDQFCFDGISFARFWLDCISMETILSCSDRVVVRRNFQVRVRLYVNGNNFVVFGLGGRGSMEFFLEFDSGCCSIEFFLSGSDRISV